MLVCKEFGLRQIPRVEDQVTKRDSYIGFAGRECRGLATHMTVLLFSVFWNLWDCDISMRSL
jgi:hypothetical protein